MSTAKNERERLRKAIAERAAPRHTLGAELRAEVAAYARSRVARGASRTSVARELGVSTTSVGRWLSDATRTKLAVKKLRPVRVAESSAKPTAPSRSFAVTSRGGLRVEALTLADVVALLRAHG